MEKKVMSEIYWAQAILYGVVAYIAMKLDDTMAFRVFTALLAYKSARSFFVAL